MCVSEGSCFRITWLSDEKWNCKSFEYRTSFCRPLHRTLLPFNSPAQIQLASKRSSYATVDVTTPWARTRHLFVQIHFCPLKLLCEPGSFFVQRRRLYSLYGCLQRKMGLQNWRRKRSLLLNVPYARTPRSSQIPINGRNVIVHEAVLFTFTRWS